MKLESLWWAQARFAASHPDTLLQVWAAKLPTNMFWSKLIVQKQVLSADVRFSPRIVLAGIFLLIGCIGWIISSLLLVVFCQIQPHFHVKISQLAHTNLAASRHSNFAQLTLVPCPAACLSKTPNDPGSLEARSALTQLGYLSILSPYAPNVNDASLAGMGFTPILATVAHPQLAVRGLASCSAIRPELRSQAFNLALAATIPARWVQLASFRASWAGVQISQAAKLSLDSLPKQGLTRARFSPALGKQISRCFKPDKLQLPNVPARIARPQAHLLLMQRQAASLSMLQPSCTSASFMVVFAHPRSHAFQSKPRKKKLALKRSGANPDFRRALVFSIASALSSQSHIISS